ncbi:glycosyl transferase [Mycolicibacterium chubuense]|uniref:Dolichyl-phosphate-mannose-protein mannosyltransferase n=1 Tax=Mycolicibacterium chubuense TaxID=1800 RepID=A0A0J6WAF8_MYCCU|nr:glycosyltransferase family 39 protein [Mycolicibacterium chubuense]KMO80160.1 Dolichyl-phosphate-mannose-protein mannosyltransferase [Mycolicibacterium chubuense]ORA54968.1 glycosyl transferase [Mycolicibacterium chubuense]SPY45490.1 PMT family glycosyltransferase, 4-amino-4-deoxy-L-arabinose transferase [Mycolicibacterium chubuense]
MSAEQTRTRPIRAAGARGRVCSPALVALLIGTAVLYLWDLGASKWANAFYAAAVQAGSTDATAMLFGSSDAANAITVDKTPAALWVMDLSARLFGFNPWSMLVPQALMGVAAVALIYAGVCRLLGPGAGLLAGAILALTPVAALMFRFNNPDALLVLMLVLAAYCTQRACEKDASRWWLVAAGAAVGFGFLAKMLQALLVLPALGAAYLLAGHRPLRTRLLDTVLAALTVVVSAGWYVALVELWPAAARPYIGGSQHNSIVELALGYNGVGRLTGNEPGGLGNLNHDVGWGRLLGYGMGADIGWLLPAAVICIAAGIVLTRRAPRTDPTRAALVLWGGWLAVTAVVFSFMNGIVHPYYTVALAPAIAAGTGIGATLLWRNRTDIRAATSLAGTVVVTVVLAAQLLSRTADWMPWLRAAVAVGGVGAAALILVAGRLGPVAARVVAGVAVVSCLAAPAAYAVATAATPHSGALPSVGPSRGGGFSGGGLLSSPTPRPALIRVLSADADRFTWAAAVVGSNNAAGYQLATGAPVMAVGGFNGTDPSPTLDQFVRAVSEGRIHYFIQGRVMTMGRSDASEAKESVAIRNWVDAHFPAQTVDGTVIYDLTADISQPAHSAGQR